MDTTQSGRKTEKTTPHSNCGSKAVAISGEISEEFAVSQLGPPGSKGLAGEYSSSRRGTTQQIQANKQSELHNKGNNPQESTKSAESSRTGSTSSQEEERSPLTFVPQKKACVIEPTYISILLAHSKDRTDSHHIWKKTNTALPPSGWSPDRSGQSENTDNLLG